jgi:hypothetical protein
MKLDHSLTWVRRRGKKKPVSGPRRPRPLELEALEDRLTPSVVFRPHFTNSGGLPAETLTADSRNAAQVNPQVFVLFWGNYWGTAQGAVEAQRLLTSTKSIIASPYLTKEIQYGSDGKATFGASFIDKDHNPPPNFTTGNLGSFLQHSIDDEGSPIPRPTTTPTSNIYIVITDPSATSSSSGAGYNTTTYYTEPNLAGTKDAMNSIWAGTTFLSDATIDKREFTEVVSHELAENVSDPRKSGVHVAPPASLPAYLKGDAQIGDNEPAGPRYGYPVNGCIVQPYWSVQDAAFVVADGNQQELLLDPDWDKTNQFLSTYALTIKGDQRGLNFTDYISVSQDASGSVGVSLNAETFRFEPGVISSITINGGFGADFVNLSSAVNTTVNGTTTTTVVITGAGKGLVTINQAKLVKIDASQGVVGASVTINNASSVNVGNSRADRIGNPVIIHSPNVTTALTVDDRFDPASGLTTTVQGYQVARSSLPAIFYDAGRLSSLSILVGNGSNSVILGGVLDPLDRLAPKITVTGKGPTALTIDGESSVDNLFTLSNGSVQGATRVHVIKPSGIGYVTTVHNQINYSAIKSLKVQGQTSAGTTFLVKSSQASTPVFLIGGTSLDEYDFGNSSTSLDNLAGPVTVRGGGRGTVIVDDSYRNSMPNELVDNFAIDAGTITRNATAFVVNRYVFFKAMISYANVSQVNLFGSNLPTNFSVLSTAPGAPLSVRGGTGVNTFQVGDATHPLDLLLADVTVTGNGTLALNDVAAGTPHDYVFSAAQFDRTASASVHFGGLQTINFSASPGTHNITVNSTAAGTTLIINGGGGPEEQIGLEGDSNELLGPIVLHVRSAHDLVEYIDINNPNPQTYTITNTMIRRSGQADITYDGAFALFLFEPAVGGNKTYIQSIGPAAVKTINSDGDQVIVGSLAPNTGGSLQGIRQTVEVVTNDPNASISLLIDDSADPDTTPRQVFFTKDSENQINVLGLAPLSNVIAWNLTPTSSVKILGGPADETFFIQPVLSETPLSIDGGGGTNTLDYSAWVNSPGLVSWYQGEGNADDATDQNPGTASPGVTFGPGEVGQAFHFNGVDSEVRVPNSSTLEPSTVTVELWINSSTPGDQVYLLSKGASGGSYGSYALDTASGDGLFFDVLTSLGFVRSPAAALASVFDGQWHHVAGTFDGQAVRLFVDGVEQGSGTLLPETTSIVYGLSTHNDLLLGNYDDGAHQFNYHFQGFLDEVSVYNHALSAADVQAIFAAGSAGKSSAGVYVNLQTGTATALSGIANIQNVVGSSLGDVLVGNGGNVLGGGAGNDLLIAGGSASWLFGGSGNDILIGGSTDYDLDRAALTAIMNELATSTDQTFGSVASDLFHGSNGLPALTANTVHANGLANQLTGGAAADWFFASSLDQALDFSAADPDLFTAI